MSELDEQIANRRKKRSDLAERGVDAFPARCDFDLEPAAVQAQFGGRSAEELAAEKHRLRVPGRIRAIREQGKLVFVDLHDGTGKLQLFIRRNLLDAASNELLDALDLGDYLLAEGELLRTRVGELSIAPERLTLLAKALRPLPEKWHGLADTEIRYRQRYLDLVANPDSRRVFEIRAGIVSGLRAFFDRHGFLEVETPMMQAIPGGASARPFATHHNALDIDLYLRIAPELYLKRLLVGGMHRVYEINRNFRNEGLSTQHNPEFTMLEFYWAYSNYEHLMDVTEELIGELAERVLGKKKLLYKGTELDLSPPWPRLSMGAALQRFAGLSEEQTATVSGLVEAFRVRGVEPPKAASAGGAPNYGLLLSALFEELCEEHLEQPVFIIDHPVEISPLSKQKPEDPRFTERFELYIGGMEIANAFSELNDPDVQAERFLQQLAARDAGDAEAHRFDSDYVRALEHAMPPAGGEGVGIDRLTMIFADRASIRDVILFPLLRPERPAPVGDGGGAGGAGRRALRSAWNERRSGRVEVTAGNLPFSLALALRYLRSTRKDAFVSFLSLVAAAGIGLGVAALVLALAALTGMQQALTAEILARTPAVEIQLPASLGASSVTALAERIRGDLEVVAVQQALSGKGWIVASGRVLPVELTGFEGEVPAQFPGASGKSAGLYLGDREAARLGIAPATIVTIASPRPTLTPFGPQPRAVNLRLAGLFRSGRSEQQARAALPIDRAVALFGGDRPQRLFVGLTSLSAAGRVAARLEPLLPEGARVSTWQELNRPLFFALRLEKSVMFVAVSLIVIVAALALVADLSLIAANKRREIGLLVAMGGSSSTLRASFCWLGAMLGGIGTFAGAAIGSAAALILDRSRLIRMPGDVYFLDYLPFAVPVWDLVVIVSVTLLWALACSWYGASRVARLDPMEALRG